MRVEALGGHSSGVVYLQGAHVTSFRPGDGEDLLFVSARSAFEPGAAIRGGVPICFPWFGPRAGDADAPMHGFARRSVWELEAVERASGGEVRLVLSLRDGAASRAVWDHGFALRFTVEFGRALVMTLETTNRNPEGGDAFTFESALHTYLRVGDIEGVSIEGLQGRSYIDKMDAMKVKVEQAPALKITGETDRVYQGTPDRCVVRDASWKRAVAVEKEGSQTTVIWNPWIEKAERLKDMGDDEWRLFVCVESANVGEHAVTLAPGQTHAMRATLGPVT